MSAEKETCEDWNEKGYGLVNVSRGCLTAPLRERAERFTEGDGTRRLGELVEKANVAEKEKRHMKAHENPGAGDEKFIHSTT